MSLEAIEIAKPCIDMKDAGFNIELSQELKIHQSFEEYLKALMLIHSLHSKFGFPGKNSGTIFNVSIGYNFEGIQNKNVQWFLNKMRNAGRLKQEYINIVSEYYSDILNIDIPSEISNSLTLSTMHGCPP